MSSSYVVLVLICQTILEMSILLSTQRLQHQKVAIFPQKIIGQHIKSSINWINMITSNFPLFDPGPDVPCKNYKCTHHAICVPQDGQPTCRCPTCSEQYSPVSVGKGKKEMFYLMTHSTHFRVIWHRVFSYKFTLLKTGRKEMFYLMMYTTHFTVIWHRFFSYKFTLLKTGRKEMFYLMMYTTHFTVIWHRFFRIDLAS